MSASTHDIKVLNSLIEGLIDCAEAYTEAANSIEDARYRQWFERRAADRIALAEDFKKEVRLRGGSPADNGSTLAKAQRAFSGFTQAVLGSQKPMLETLKASEAKLMARFDDAINDTQISAPTREVLRRGLIRFGEGENDLATLSAQINNDQPTL